MTERPTENKQKVDGILPLGSSRLHFVGKIGGGGGLLCAWLRRTACDVMEANVRVSPIDNFLVVPKRIAATHTHAETD